MESINLKNVDVVVIDRKELSNMEARLKDLEEIVAGKTVTLGPWVQHGEDGGEIHHWGVIYTGNEKMVEKTAVIDHGIMKKYTDDLNKRFLSLEKFKLFSVIAMISLVIMIIIILWS